MKRTLTTYIVAILITAPALLATAQDYKQALAEAEKAYDNGVGNGDEAVRELIERNPGNIQLAQEGLQIILRGISGHDEEWRNYATSSLFALEELGVLSLAHDVTLQIDYIQLDFDLKAGRRLSAGILFEKIEESYPSWDRLDDKKKHFREGIPPYRLEPPHTGSPMKLIALDNMGDDRWDKIRDANPAAIAETIDKRIKITIAELGKSSWEKRIGYLEDWTALDMHLRSQPLDKHGALREPAEKLAPLRAYQEKKLQENPDNLSADALSVFRRFPWAETAHRRLLDYAAADLTRGSLQAAYRSFDDVRTHSVDADLRKRAADGCKLTLSIAEKASTQAESQAPDLSSLKMQAVAPPPILPWRFGRGFAHVMRPEYPELQIEDDHVVLSGRRYLAVYGRSKTDLPKWIRTEGTDIGPFNGTTSGSYSPALIDGKVYTRNLSSETAAVMNVIDLAGGTDLWAMGRYGWTKSIEISTETAPALNDYQQFLSKPVLADGALLYLSFERGPRNPKLYCSVVAVDAETRRVLWRSLIDVIKSGMPEPHLFGIPPIVHKGFVYAVSSRQTVSCHDLRDGHLVWVHEYSSFPQGGLPRYAASPVIAGKRLICTPLDGTTSTFALDLDTGRMIWRNPDVYADEQIGHHDGNVLVRDDLTVAALSVEDGKIRWSHRFEKPIIGRVQLMGDRAYVATERMMAVLSAGDGTLLEKRLWESKDGPPQAVRVDGDRLFVVGNIPYLDPAKNVFNMAAPKAPGFKLPLQLAWTLSVDHESKLIPPPPGSPLAGKTYYLKAGVITCIEANPQGGIVWQRFVRQRQRVSGNLFTFEKGVQPMFFGEVIVLRNGEAFIAFNGRTGERLWSRNISHARQGGSSGDSIWCRDDRLGKVSCLDSKTGRTLWQQGFNGPVNISVQGSVMHVLQTSGKELRHFVVNLRTGQRVKTYEVIKLGDKDVLTHIYMGSQGALIYRRVKLPELLSYKLDGKPVRHVKRQVGHFQVLASSDKYIVLKEQRAHADGDDVVVYKFGDAGYRATPFSGEKFHGSIFELDGERLICVQPGHHIVLFDLQAKKILHDSHVRESRRKKSDEEKRHNFISRPEGLIRHGNRLFVQMTYPTKRVQEEGSGIFKYVPAIPAPSYFLDLQTGKTTDATGSMLYGGQNKSFHGPSIPRYSNGLIMKSTRHMEKIGYVHAIQCWSPAE